MSIIYAPGVSSKSLTVQIVDDSGLPVTGLLAATFPSVFYQIAGPNAAVAFPALSDLALITTAWLAGGVKELSGGEYRLDAPDAMFAAAGKVKVYAEASGKHLLLEIIDVGYPQVDARQWLGGTIPPVATTGIPIVDLNAGTAISSTQTAGTIGAALLAMEAQGVGKWVIDSVAKTLTIYRRDGVTPVRVFNLDSVDAPKSRA